MENYTVTTAAPLGTQFDLEDYMVANAIEGFYREHGVDGRVSAETSQFIFPVEQSARFYSLSFSDLKEHIANAYHYAYNYDWRNEEDDDDWAHEWWK